MIILGIDPGLDGAFAWVRHVEGRYILVDVLDMPTFDVERNKKNKRELDLRGIKHAVNKHVLDTHHAFIEQVSASPQMGVTSAFSFGGSFWAMRLAVVMAGTPYTLVAPPRWKRMVGLKVGATKDESRRRAMDILLNCGEAFDRKMDADRAEAALIAVYGHKALLL